MAKPSEDALSEAVNALYRIRAVEQPPDAEGLREVWHQCAQGADLLSVVDAKGHVVRQELTLLEDFFRWTSAQGLSTGHTAEGSGQLAMKAAADVAFDEAISPERVMRASHALSSYKGDDKYIRNIQRVLGMVARGMQSFEEVTVTRSVRSPSELPAPPAQTGRPGLWMAVTGAVLLAIVGALVALFFKS